MLRRFPLLFSLAALVLIALPAVAQNVTEFPLTNIPGGAPFSMTIGPDGNLWFTDQKVSSIVRITTAGVATRSAI
jgi:streptogramin lyase